MQRDDALVWIDLEMTGLDPDTCLIVEIATIITDSNLEIVAEGPNEVIHLPEDILQVHLEKNDFFREHPSNVLLHDAIRESSVGHEEIELQTLSFIKEYVPPNTSPLCGNSIHMDRMFLLKHMPSITDYLHYRNIDVSTVKELARRWKPEVYEQASAQKKGSHRALDDIKESIAELKFYRDTFFRA